MLLPKGTSADDVADIGRGISAAASAIGVTICGGHTEITSAVNRPVICGTMAGILSRGAIKRKESIRPGHRIVMTKTAGNEGTAILARECGAQFLRLGIHREVLDAAADFLSRLSVLPEARSVRSTQGVAAMHDVTEGGVATALLELIESSGCGLTIDLDAIPVDSVTAEICEAVRLDPLGLIGSGSLLLAVEEESVRIILEHIRAEGIAAAVIAEVVEPGRGVMAHRAGHSVSLPRFERDEINKMFD